MGYVANNEVITSLFVQYSYLAAPLTCGVIAELSRCHGTMGAK